METHLEGEGRRGARLRRRQGAAWCASIPRYFRPTEVETLLGDPTKARDKLGWKAKVSFPGAGGRDDGGRPGRSRARRARQAPRLPHPQPA